MPLPQLKKPVGVVDGEDVRTLFEYARANKFAIPAINVCKKYHAIGIAEGVFLLPFNTDPQLRNIF